MTRPGLCLARLLFVVLLFATWSPSLGAEQSQTCDADNVCAAAAPPKSRFSRLLSIVPGANGVPLHYVLHMAQLLKPGISWVELFCDGNATGCTEKYNWPGPQTYSQIGWEKVRELGSQMPRNEWSGKWWRGNELGTLIDNPFYYAGLNEHNRTSLSPLAIALGISPKQHAAVRPVFERAFALTEENHERMQKLTEESIADFIERHKTTGSFNNIDLKVWFHILINKITFNRDVSVEYAKAFVDTQTAMLGTQLISQGLPRRLYGLDPLKLKATRDKVVSYVNEYKPLIQEQYGDLLEGQDCSPSESCIDQAAYAVFDGLLAAGGVSVPGTIFQALSVLYSKDKSNPAGPGLVYKPGEELQLHWEAIRIFPPVVAFPYWDPRPTCAGLSKEETAALSAPDGNTAPCPLGPVDPHTGYPKVNQYQGGMRFLPNLAIAQMDPEKWGPDSRKFKLRPLEHYEKYSLGFAEMAVDPNVAGGRMNRNCPGKHLSLLMGSTFFKMFKQAEWITNPRTPIKIKLGGPYVADYPIYSKESIEKCHREKCRCKPGGGILSNPHCKLCVRRKCPM